MKTVNRFVGCILLLLPFGILQAQRTHFVYFQTEGAQPFYVQWKGKNYSSTAAGYAILPGMEEGRHTVAIGLPGKQGRQEYDIELSGRDRGFLVKDFGEGRGWGLFDLQTMAVQMDGALVRARQEEEKRKAEAAEALVRQQREAEERAAAEAESRRREEAEKAAAEMARLKREEEAKAGADKQQQEREASERQAAEQERQRRESEAKARELAQADSLKEAAASAERKRIADAELERIRREREQSAARPAGEVKPPVASQADTTSEKPLSWAEITRLQEEARRQAARSKEGGETRNASEAKQAEHAPAKPTTRVIDGVERQVAREVPRTETKAETPAMPREETFSRAKPAEEDAAAPSQSTDSKPASKARKSSDPASKTNDANDSDSTVRKPKPKEIRLPPIGRPKESKPKADEKERETEEPEFLDFTITPDSTGDLPPVPVPAPVTKEAEPDSSTAPVRQPARDTAAPAPAAPRDTTIRAVTEPGSTVYQPLGNADSAVLARQCPETATEADIEVLKVLIRAEKSAEDGIDLARKLMRIKCVRSSQVRTLAGLFTADADRYQLLDMAYRYTSDPGNYTALEDLLKDPYYLNRFRAMLR